MILAATKYADVASWRGTRSTRREGSPAFRVGRRACPPLRRVAIYVPRRQPVMSLAEWVWWGLKPGGWLRNYVAEEKYHYREQIRAIARYWHGRPRYNLKTEWELEYSLPPRLVHRLMQLDPNLLRDRTTLRNLKKDDDELTIHV